MVTKELISIVIPIMNEEGNVSILTERLKKVLNNKWNYQIIFIDDGSTDNTLDEIKRLRKEDENVYYLSLSRNFGHQNALKAGLDFAEGNCVISMDGDLQHPPELIPEMIKMWQDGFDVVYTIRKDDQKTSFFKRITSSFFYSLINRLSDVNIEQGSADFRLIDKSIVAVIRNLNENPIFFRGMIRWLGFNQIAIEYVSDERIWGRTKYSFGKMFRFALIGITSFSIKPLHFSSLFGVVLASLSFLYGIYAIILKLFTNNTLPGWTSLLIVVSFIGGVQLLMIGILGEYIGKLFIESKKRPAYLVKEKNINIPK